MTREFYKYAETGKDVIKRKGMEKFCNALGISLVDPVILVIAYRMGAKKMVSSKKILFLKLFIGIIHKELICQGL